jgi:teichuronic acid biosynthesis glycosyltransferase TuaG
MSKPTVSIITAVFDGEKYIRECILSVQNQTNSDFEHIIIDDNSNDNTVKIIKDLIKDDLRFKIIRIKS